jgi:hypothetical protein
MSVVKAGVVSAINLSESSKTSISSCLWNGGGCVFKCMRVLNLNTSVAPFAIGRRDAEEGCRGGMQRRDAEVSVVARFSRPECCQFKLAFKNKHPLCLWNGGGCVLTRIPTCTSYYQLKSTTLIIVHTR